MIHLIQSSRCNSCEYCI